MTSIDDPYFALSIDGICEEGNHATGKFVDVFNIFLYKEIGEIVVQPDLIAQLTSLSRPRLKRFIMRTLANFIGELLPPSNGVLKSFAHLNSRAP